MAGFLCLSLLLGACVQVSLPESTPDAPPRVLTVLNTCTGLQTNVLKRFEAAFDCRVNVLPVIGNEAAVDLLRSGRGTVDVVIAERSALHRMHVLRLLDTPAEGIVDESALFTTEWGLVYRKDQVETPPRSWEDLWSNPTWLLGIPNERRLVLLAAAQRRFGDEPTTGEAIKLDGQEVAALFSRGAILGTVSELMQTMASGGIDVSMGFPSATLNPALAFVTPSEGTISVGYGVYPTLDSPLGSLAAEFTSFVRRPDIQPKIMNLGGEYASIVLGHGVDDTAILFGKERLFDRIWATTMQPVFGVSLPDPDAPSPEGISP